MTNFDPKNVLLLLQEHFGLPTDVAISEADRREALRLINKIQARLTVKESDDWSEDEIEIDRI